MNLRVIAIDQRLALGTNGDMQNFLVLELPNGKEARAAIDLETTKQLLQLDAEHGENGGAPTTPQRTEVASEWSVPGGQPPVHTTGLQPAPQAEEDAPLASATEAEMVDWSKLADEILSPSMKAAFMHLKLPPRLTPAQVRSIEEEVMGKFGEEEWEEVLGPMAASLTPQKKPAAVAPPPPAPVLNQVQWADGAPMLSNTRPARTVPKTPMGYPIPQDGTVDPGELVGGTDQDEDGVGQL